MLPPPPHATLFPYPTLFRSGGDDEDGAAVAAVTAARAAARDAHFAAERHAAVAAAAGCDVDVDFVDEHERGGCSPAELALFDRDDADAAAVRAVARELHGAGDLGEQRVVLAAADVVARAELAAALTDENRPAGHQVAVVPLHAEALRIAVAPVA